MSTPNVASYYARTPCTMDGAAALAIPTPWRRAQSTSSSPGPSGGYLFNLSTKPPSARRWSLAFVARGDICAADTYTLTLQVADRVQDPSAGIVVRRYAAHQRWQTLRSSSSVVDRLTQLRCWLPESHYLGFQAEIEVIRNERAVPRRRPAECLARQCAGWTTAPRLVRPHYACV